MKMLGKNKACYCKNKNVWYPQGHNVFCLFSVFSVNNSDSLQYSTKIEPTQENFKNKLRLKLCQAQVQLNLSF